MNHIHVTYVLVVFLYRVNEPHAICICRKLAKYNPYHAGTTVQKTRHDLHIKYSISTLHKASKGVVQQRSFMPSAETSYKTVLGSSLCKPHHTKSPKIYLPDESHIVCTLHKACKDVVHIILGRKVLHIINVLRAQHRHVCMYACRSQHNDKHDLPASISKSGEQHMTPYSTAGSIIVYACMTSPIRQLSGGAWPHKCKLCSCCCIGMNKDNRLQILLRRHRASPGTHQRLADYGAQHLCSPGKLQFLRWPSL